MNPLDIIGMSASIVSFSMFFPQASRVWRLRHTPSALTGVSPAGQWMLLLNATLWAIYGIGTGAYWTAVPSFINAPMALGVLCLLARGNELPVEEAVAGPGAGDTRPAPSIPLTLHRA